MQIEESRWSVYFAELTRQAEGCDTTIEVLSDTLGDQIEVRHAPLSELSFDPREGIAVSVGDAQRHIEVLRHVIARPSRVEATDEPGIPAALMIEEDTGTKTLLRFE